MVNLEMLILAFVLKSKLKTNIAKIKNFFSFLDTNYYKWTRTMDIRREKAIVNFSLHYVCASTISRTLTWSHVCMLIQYCEITT